MGKLIKKIGFEIELAVSGYGQDEIDAVNDNHNLGLEFCEDGSIDTEGDCDYNLEIKTNEPKNYTEIIRIANHLFPVLKWINC